MNGDDAVPRTNVKFGKAIAGVVRFVRAGDHRVPGLQPAAAGDNLGGAAGASSNVAGLV